MFETKEDVYLYNYQFPIVTLVTGSQFLFTIFANLLCLRFFCFISLPIFLPSGNRSMPSVTSDM